MAVNGLRNNIPEAAFQRLRGDPAGACRANRVARQSVIVIGQGKYSLSLEVACRIAGVLYGPAPKWPADLSGPAGIDGKAAARRAGIPSHRFLSLTQQDLAFSRAAVQLQCDHDEF